VADMRNAGTALFSWLTDQVGAAAAGASVTWADYTGVDMPALASFVTTQYIQEIPTLDGWKGLYEYRLNTANPLAQRVMAIRSLGRNKAAEQSSVYLSGAFDPTDYDQDIVWADGYFVRWPQKLTS
jgi:hypothetical protein